MHITSMPGVFSRQDPVDSAPVVFDIPRSGAEYPRWFSCQAPMSSVQRSISSYVEELYARVPEARAHWLYASFPNVVIDPNRHESDIDPEQLDGSWPVPLRPSEKCRAGIGLIPMLAGDVRLYASPLNVADVSRRLDELYYPYHRELARLLQSAKARTGAAYHLSCHSMGALNPATSKAAGQRRSDFDLGDRNGTTCEPRFVDFVSDCLKEFGYQVTVNEHFIGAEAVRKHGNPANGVHSLQIEMNRDLYMDEKAREKSRNFEQVQLHMLGLARKVVEYAESKRQT